MTSSQKFSDMFTGALEWVADRCSATMTWLTEDRASIREKLTQRLSDLFNSSSIMSATGATFGRNALRMLGDKLSQGHVTQETYEAIREELANKARSFSPEDQQILRDVRRLKAAGGFTDEEGQEILNQAQQRVKSPSSRER